MRAGMGATVAAFSSSPPPPPLMAAKGSDSGGNQSEQTVSSEGRVGAVDRKAIMEAALVEVVRVNTAIFVSNPSNRHSYRTMVSPHIPVLLKVLERVAEEPGME